MYILSEINIYPIKSLAGISLQTCEVEERGLKYDRRWVLVDETNTFITQRKFPEMALIKVSIEKDGLKLQHKTKNIGPLLVPFNFEHKENSDVVIWEDTVQGVFYNKEIDEWFSNLLDLKCRLVKMPDSTKRQVNKKYIKNKIVSFADGYPFLIIGQASLEDLNSRLEDRIPMNRFRPNFVFTDGKAYEEDTWKKFKIGTVKFQGIKPSIRCVITTINQETAELTHEPLKTLAKYRRVEGGVIFGMNVICKSLGIVSVGDEISKSIF
jgi:MOSC domain-containing protein